MYLLLKMVLFHGYVSLPEGMYRKLKRVEIGKLEMHLFRASLRLFLRFFRNTLLLSRRSLKKRRHSGLSLLPPFSDITFTWADISFTWDTFFGSWHIIIQIYIYMYIYLFTRNILSHFRIAFCNSPGFLFQFRRHSPRWVWWPESSGGRRYTSPWNEQLAAENRHPGKGDSELGIPMHFEGGNC